MKFSLTKAIVASHYLGEGVLSHPDGYLLKSFVCNPLPSGTLEENFEGPVSDQFFAKLSELLTRLPSGFEGQIVLVRSTVSLAQVDGFETKIYAFERVQKKESYSHLKSVFDELKIQSVETTEKDWLTILASYFGESLKSNYVPDVNWEKDGLSIADSRVKVLSLTELPQLTWKGCLQSIFEYPDSFLLSFKFHIPDRNKVRKQLETKRRVSHALSITSSLEVKNIEGNSVLHSSEETLERILVNKETLFEISVGIVLHGPKDNVEKVSYDFERSISGVGNAGLFREGLGSLPIFKSHIPGNKMMGIRKLPILSENLAQLFPLLLDYTRSNDSSHLTLRSRCLESSYLNLFSKENINYNSFICGASGSGKSFLMNAILSSQVKDEPNCRLCIFDVGGSYRKIVQANGGHSLSLSADEAQALMATFIRKFPVVSNGFYKTLIESLCGGGSHITHSHSVAITDLLQMQEGETLKIGRVIKDALAKSEKFYQEVGHWLKPHVGLDKVTERLDLLDLICAKVSSFDFKDLESNPVLQRTTILLLSELLWRDLVKGTYPRTLVVFDEVWRFFAQSRSFLEEMYRTLRKYKAGIVSITQNLADYGDDAFAKMIFTNSFTKIFLQNGAAAEYLKNTFDMPESDIERAISVTSKKPYYSEFFALTPTMSQIFRLYPTKEFYELANTENIATKEE